MVIRYKVDFDTNFFTDKAKKIGFNPFEYRCQEHFIALDQVERYIDQQLKLFFRSDIPPEEIYKISEVVMDNRFIITFNREKAHTVFFESVLR